MTDQQKLQDREHLEQGTGPRPRFGSDGLITAVVQDCETREILMLAHMNAEALAKTIETETAHFWSRSRKQLWMKGETSGNTLSVEEILMDCDQDAVILTVRLNGTSACHTGARSCFYRKVVGKGENLELVRADEGKQRS